MKVKRNIIEIDENLCDGCGQCALACAEGAIEIVNGKAKLISESYCDGLGACISECPQGAIKIVEKEAEDFDPEEVEKHLQERKTKEICPSVAKQSKNWPIKLKLISEKSPFLKGANLMMVADCVPAIYRNFHDTFVKEENDVILIGCPKFDDREEYVRKLAVIFKNSPIKSVKVINMEVPCCSALATIVKKAMELAKVEIPLEETTISIQGKIR